MNSDRTEHNDLICQTGDCPPLLACGEVQAVCTGVKKIYFGPFKLRWVFVFEVFLPTEYAKTKLDMYVRIDPKWKNPPISSKLWKVAAIAFGGRPRRVVITKAIFVDRMFRCKLRTVGEGTARYSVIETILEKLTQ